MTLPAGSRLSPYEILSAVGAGGMGEVYKARDTRLIREGRELVYMEPPNRLMSVEVAAGDTFRPGIPRLLFEARFRQRAGRSYDFSPDDERIIANVVLGEESREQPITLVVNWMAGLPAK